MAQYEVTVHLIEPVLFRVDATERLRVNKAVDAAWKGAPWYVKEEFGEEYYKECECLFIHIVHLPCFLIVKSLKCAIILDIIHLMHFVNWKQLF